MFETTKKELTPMSKFIIINLIVFLKGDRVKSLSKNISVAVIVVTPINVFSSPNRLLNITTNTTTNIKVKLFDIINFLFIYIPFVYDFAYMSTILFLP